MKYSYKQFKEMTSWKFKDKLLWSQQLILYWLKKKKKPMVACSWGKASTVLLHMVLRFCKHTIVCFHNTLVQYPETYEYRDKMLKLLKIENYVETKPIKTFWECVEQYGFPKLRQMAWQGKNRTPRCCYYMKEKPAIDLIKKLNIDVNFVGIQATESMVRRLSFLREGEAYFSKKYNCWIVRPLIIWTDEDIFRYYKEFDLPINPIYEKGFKRSGCLPCTGFKNWREVLRKANPKLYEYISEKMGTSLLTKFIKCNTFSDIEEVRE